MSSNVVVSGQEFEEPCPTCNGKGTENKNVKISVKIPEGVDNEQQIRLAGEGAPEKMVDHTVIYMLCSE
ncbi:molecular chaperone DnaJ [Staphylococcus gallinarum]|uniref:Molecular chaperone DnaJ n=1 Tax=Staphylococcus gallinarum TaxID=1293 RepID=A0A380FIH9_STAGA|nr:molecular chaperone DnaJ [Staphylococcus gallinarum]